MKKLSNSQIRLICQNPECGAEGQIVEAKDVTASQRLNYLCAKCYKKVAKREALPGMADRPHFFLPSELDSFRDFEREPDFAKDCSRVLIRDGIRQGKTQAEAKKNAWKEVNRLLRSLSRYQREGQEEFKKLYARDCLKQASSGFQSQVETLRIFQQKGGNKSAATKKNRKEIEKQVALATQNRRREDFLWVIFKILRTPGPSNDFTFNEIQTFLTHLSAQLPPSPKYPAGVSGLDLTDVWKIHNLWNPKPVSRSTVGRLLDDENRNSWFGRFRRHCDYLRTHPAHLPADLVEMIVFIFDGEQPQDVEVSECLAQPQGMPDSEGNPTHKYVWANIHWCQTISAARPGSRYPGNIERAYLEDDARAGYERKRIEEFGKFPALLDRLT